MPTLQADELHGVLRELFEAAGVPGDRAEVVADHLTKANLVGHDSHGVIRAPGYVDLILNAKIIPEAPIEVHNDGPSTAVVDGNWGLGFAATNFATDLAVEKARATGVGSITIKQQSHMGRLGWYSERAARAGMICFVTADSGRAPKVVAPLGGSDRRLGTNPLSFAFPTDLPAPVVLDMATSTIAMGKVRVARARGERLPEDCVIDSSGRPTRDPKAMDDGTGALLPFGGDQAHKGYGLAFVVEVFSGLLTGIGYSHDPGGFSNDGAFVTAFSVERFQPLAGFKSLVAEFIDYLKESPLAEDADEILYPGEIEHRTECRRREEGILIEDDTWSNLEAAAGRVGMSLPSF